MTLARRTPFVALVLALLAGFLVTLAQPLPTAHAGETATTKGNYVALPTPTRLLNRSIAAGSSYDFSATGVAGVPQAGTTAVQLIVTVTNATSLVGRAYVDTNCVNACPEPSYGSSLAQGGPMSNTIVADVDPARTTNQLRARVVSDYSMSLSVQVDVVGYYTTTSAGGGFVATRKATLFDTRANGGTSIPAGGTVTKTLTGGVIPVGASVAHIDLVAIGITAAGGIVAVPAGTPTTGYPSLTFWSNAVNRSGLVSVKLSAAGQVTFKNTSTQSVHLYADAEGYTTSSPSTGADLQPVTTQAWDRHVPAGQSVDIQVAGSPVSNVPSGAAAIYLHVEAYLADSGGSLRIYPKGQAQSTAPWVNFTADTNYSRPSGVLMVPGDGGKVTIEAASTGDVSVRVQPTAYFAPPSSYAPTGGVPATSVAHTSSGDCYAYLDPSVSAVRAGCDPQDGGEPIYAMISPPGHSFRSPVSMVARPGGRYVVTALHAPDGEVWTWDLPYSEGAPPAVTGVRTFRYSRTPVVTGSLPDGAPVGFTTDGEGRAWVIDLNTAAPAQPRWTPLNVPTLAPAPGGTLTSLSDATGILLAGVTTGGDVVTARYAGPSTGALVWQSLGATGAAGKVALGLSKSSQARAAVRHGDGTVRSANLTPAGTTVDGWHPVTTTYDGTPVTATGSPAVIYDPQTERNAVLIRSAVGGGTLYRVAETTPESGDFSGTLYGVPLDTGGIASDMTVWDYRTDEPPLYRRWSVYYLDNSYARKLATSYAS